jgi:hypothetical protein
MTDTAKSARFFTVFSPEGEAPAKVQHATHKAAFSAAKRMAEAFPGQTFYVMKSSSVGFVKESESEA